MAEYIESICHSCFHSYVCEQFNRHRDSHNEKCHFYNDHFVPTADVIKVGSCDGCHWKGMGRFQKCTYCRRNRNLKDRFEERRGEE